MKITHVALGLALGACSTSGVSSNNGSIGTESDAVIGGQSDTRFAAVGTIGVKVDDHYQFNCTATLIGPTTVLTAKHCLTSASGGALFDEQAVFFALGNANRPDRLIQIVAGKLAAPNSGGAAGYGSDVAAANLVEAVTDVEPVLVADRALAARDQGKRFITMGFGSKDPAQEASDGERASGPLTANALQGKAFEQAFGSFDNFKAWAAELYGADFVDAYLEEFKAWYDEATLLDGYELWAGARAGDVRLVEADGGAPLVLSEKTRQGVKTSIFGVLSAPIASSTTDYGSFFATFGPGAAKAISEAQSWSDPCVGETIIGRCDGTVAIRCSGLGEGPRRMLQTDCADLDQVCLTDATTGNIGCGEFEAPTPVE